MKPLLTLTAMLISISAFATSGTGETGSAGAYQPTLEGIAKKQEMVQLANTLQARYETEMDLALTLTNALQTASFKCARHCGNEKIYNELEQAKQLITSIGDTYTTIVTARNQIDTAHLPELPEFSSLPFKSHISDGTANIVTAYENVRTFLGKTQGHSGDELYHLSTLLSNYRLQLWDMKWDKSSISDTIKDSIRRDKEILQIKDCK